MMTSYGHATKTLDRPVAAYPTDCENFAGRNGLELRATVMQYQFAGSGNWASGVVDSSAAQRSPSVLVTGARQARDTDKPRTPSYYLERNYPTNFIDRSSNSPPDTDVSIASRAADVVNSVRQNTQVQSTAFVPAINISALANGDQRPIATSGSSQNCQRNGYVVAPVLSGCAGGSQSSLATTAATFRSEAVVEYVIASHPVRNVCTGSDDVTTACQSRRSHKYEGMTYRQATTKSVKTTTAGGNVSGSYVCRQTPITIFQEPGSCGGDTSEPVNMRSREPDRIQLTSGDERRKHDSWSGSRRRRSDDTATSADCTRTANHRIVLTSSEDRNSYRAEVALPNQLSQQQLPTFQTTFRCRSDGIEDQKHPTISQTTGPRTAPSGLWIGTPTKMTLRHSVDTILSSSPSSSSTTSSFSGDISAVVQSAKSSTDASKCDVCCHPVTAADHSALAAGSTFHIDCLVCVVCQRSLQSRSFYRVGRHLYCEADYKYVGFQQDAHRCVVCANVIFDSLLQAMGNCYHPDCFQCTHCRSVLDGRQFTVDIRGNVYCIPDYIRTYAPKCSVCTEPVVPLQEKQKALRLVALDRNFHRSCFRCEDCKVSLTDAQGDQSLCYPFNGHVVCRACHVARLRLGAINSSATDRLPNQSADEEQKILSTVQSQCSRQEELDAENQGLNRQQGLESTDKMPQSDSENQFVVSLRSVDHSMPFVDTTLDDDLASSSSCTDDVMNEQFRIGCHRSELDDDVTSSDSGCSWVPASDDEFEDELRMRCEASMAECGPHSLLTSESSRKLPNVMMTRSKGCQQSPVTVDGNTRCADSGHGSSGIPSDDTLTSSDVDTIDASLSGSVTSGFEAAIEGDESNNDADDDDGGGIFSQQTATYEEHPFFSSSEASTLRRRCRTNDNSVAASISDPAEPEIGNDRTEEVPSNSIDLILALQLNCHDLADCRVTEL